MPVDPSILRRYAPPEAVPGRRADGPRALVIAGIGLAIIGGFFSIAWGIPAAASAFVSAVVIGNLLLVAALIVIGFREDGVIGVFYRLRHPLGTVLGGDDRPSWSVLAVALLVLVAFVLAGILLVQHPGALPSWARVPGQQHR
jgi:hypothetical protein